MTIRVLLADDHALVRAGIRALLDRIKDVEVLAEAGDGHKTMQAIAKHQPDVALIDIAMSGLNGLEVTRRVKQEYPHVHIIILSVHTSEEYIIQALHAGAAGYLHKDAASTELELALRAAISGATYLSPSVSKQMLEYIERLEQISDNELETWTPFSRLTPRQREILQLIAEGHTTQDIALKLGISGKTVESHRTQLMDRLDIHDIPGLVRFAIRIGLIQPDD